MFKGFNMLSRIKKSYIFFFLGSAMIFFTPSVHAELLKIGFVTDWEYHERNYENKLSTKAPSYLASVVKELNKKKPHITIGGGDYIESSRLNSDKCEKMLNDIDDVFKKINYGKIYYIPGNHDLRNLTTDQYQNALGIIYMHKVVDARGFRIILLDTNYDDDDSSHRSDDTYVEGYVSTNELTWLRNSINESNNPVIIFSHHSPARPDDRRDIKNSDDVRQVIEESGKVIAVVSGHNPTQLMKNYNGVRYFVVNNLVNEKARKTYAFINVKKTGSQVIFSLKQYGTKKKTYNFSKNL